MCSDDVFCQPSVDGKFCTGVAGEVQREGEAKVRSSRLTDTKSQEVQGLLEEIRRQSSVSVLSGCAIVITNVATTSVFFAKGWSTESVSRVVRTARTTQKRRRNAPSLHTTITHMTR